MKRGGSWTFHFHPANEYPNCSLVFFFVKLHGVDGLPPASSAEMLPRPSPYSWLVSFQVRIICHSLIFLRLSASKLRQTFVLNQCAFMQSCKHNLIFIRIFSASYLNFQIFIRKPKFWFFSI